MTAMSHELGREDSVPSSPVAEGSTGGGVAMPTPMAAVAAGVGYGGCCFR